MREGFSEHVIEIAVIVWAVVVAVLAAFLGG
jgi:hypothetical protein